MSFASIQFGAPEGETASTSNLVPEGERAIVVRSGGSVARYQGGEAVSQSTYVSLNTADLPSEASGEILATARSKTGSPRTGGQIGPDDVVTLPNGMQLTVSNAERMGLVERDAHGRFIERPQDGQLSGAEAAPGEETVEDQGEALSDTKAENELAAICNTTSPGSQVAVLQQLVAGDVNPSTLARAASEAGISPEEFNGKLETVVAGFADQANATIKSLGADEPSLFFQWANEHEPKALQEAMTKQGMERSTKDYAPIYSRYVQSLADHEPEAVLGATFGSGITARQDGNKVLLTIPGVGQVDYRVAVKQGLVKVSGA